MEGYTSDSYGNSFDESFEESQPTLSDPTPMVEALAGHAGIGPALELGIGSGRVARPLAERGIEVDGIEVSANMIELLKRTVAGLPIQIFQGDFADMTPPRRYKLIYCVWSTFFLLRTRDAQQCALDRIAHALDHGGVFIIETYVPQGTRFHQGQEVKVMELTAGSVSVQFSLHHPDSQIIETQRVVLNGEGIHLHPVISRYASAEELDEMAGESGLRLRSRWADWDLSPFTQASPRHISVYEAAT